MSGSITLHSKLGINPRMLNVHCFACGQTKGDAIVLLGSSNRKMKCPKCGIWVFGGVKYNEPCPKCGALGGSNWERVELNEHEHVEQNGICQECEGHMKKGIILISVKNGETGANPYRTGGWCVIKEEALRRIVNNKELADDICKKRVTFIPDEVWDKIGLPRGEAKESNEQTEQAGKETGDRKD